MDPQKVNYYGLSLLAGYYQGFKQVEPYSLKTDDSASYYISPVFDSNDEDSTYHRLVVDGDFEKNKLEVIVATCDTLEPAVQDGTITIKDYLGNPAVSYAEKQQLLQSMNHIRTTNVQDLLLHSLKGKYLWIFISVMSLDDGGSILNGISLELPKRSFTRYFPEIYHNNDFFDRYIGIFQSVFMDLEQQVDRLPNRLDYETNDDDDVATLAQWVGINNQDELFTPDQLRYIISNLDLFQGRKGTKVVVEEMIMLLVGVKPYIIEPFQWKKKKISRHMKSHYERLYGETNNSFCIVLQKDNACGDRSNTEKTIKNALEQIVPISVNYQIVFLSPTSNTDLHCYLGVNSKLSVPTAAKLNGEIIGHHIFVG